jgi:hypothetical protein
MTPDNIKNELKEILEETTTVLGGTDQTYIEFLKLMNAANKLSIPTRVFQGQLVFFKYKPQNETFKERNTYYDKYPLVLVTETYRGGFSGVNVHYIDPIHRQFLFDVIMRGLPAIRASEEWRTRLRVSYDRLKARRQFKFFRPCYRAYSWKGMKRRPIVVPFELWEEMVQSNTMRIEKARPITIFRDSYKKAIKQR